MSDPEEATITARSLMKKEFRTIEAERPLGEAMRCLLDQGDQPSPVPLLVVHSDGSLAGLLTPMALFRALLRKVRPAEIHTLAEIDILVMARDQLDRPVAEAMVREVPRAYPDDPLITLMKINMDHREKRVEFTPVLENDKVIGIVYITEIFHAAASLALTPETSGIQLDSDQDDEISH